MTKLTFPKFEGLPQFEVETAIGTVTVRPRPLEWDEEFAEKFTLAYDQMDLSFYLAESDPKRGGKDVAVQRHLIIPRDDFYKGKRFSFDFFNSEGELIGGRAVTDINLEEESCAFGWAVMCEQYRGKGIMPAVTAVLAEWVREYGFRTIEAHIHENNTSSQDHVSKIGFVNTGVRKKAPEGAPEHTRARAHAHFIWVYDPK
ncbi:GNAT family N-acetyltransferase [Shimazuella alba]|uniref:GNAT family N-acetyltransferase n=1 Tax=Shimazuella alba TaxID=2690964 RepID=A0A6I4W126_9BACL|nr:GNAT family N-acetyltransferase [Shimazuella alba]